MALILSTLNPDQEEIKTQLQAYLSTLDSWKGAVNSQTGQAILNMIAAVGAYSQASIRRYAEDAFPETVVSDEASYAIADMQGVRLTRKLPASVSVTLTSPVSLTLPAYTVFQGAGGFFFNRNAVFITGGAGPLAVTLYEGKVQRISTNGLGQDYSLFVSSESSFTVSDVDVSILLDTTPMARTTGGIWTLKNQIGFVDSTMPDGKLFIQFGNSIYGGSPTAVQTLNITYVVTIGADGNNLSTNGKTLVAPDYTTVSGLFTTSPSGGANERPALTYKNLAAPTFGVFDAAVTKQQYITTALTYPGVIDVITHAQREVNPSSVYWMNLIQLVVLTSTPSVPWTTQQRNDFMTWLQSKSAFVPRFFMQDPVAVTVNVDMDIFCFNWVNSTQAKLNAINAVTNLFAPRAGILNYDLHKTDITDAVLKSDPGIEYVTLRTPADDVIVSSTPMDFPTLTELLTGGTLTNATNYYYGLAVTTADGIVTVKNLAAKLTTTATSRIQVDWLAYPGAVSYQLYRKVEAGSLLLLYSGTALTFTDTGAITPSGAPPAQSTVPIRYISLGTLNIVDKYSTRSIRI